MKKWLIFALSVLCLIGGAACQDKNDSSIEKSSSQSKLFGDDEIELPEDMFD
ncbi:MAG: hypothetical protein IKD15_01745 [Clostridia bacterium]|nr:hypothetical protein [Clostridia bacterium]